MQTWQDVASEFPAEVAARLLPPEAKGEGKTAAHEAARVPSDLTDGERAVLRLVPADDAAHIDALAQAAGLPVHELAGLLLALEMRDLIRQLPGKCFVKKL